MTGVKPVSRSSIAPKIAASKLFRGNSQGSDLLVGRQEELKALDAALNGPDKKNVVTIVAWGGVGKTSLVARWAANTLAKPNHDGIERYFDWSFYSQGARSENDATGADKAASADIFIKEALEFFGDPDLAASTSGPWEKGERLARLVSERRSLLILDGLEPLQDAKTGDLRDKALRALLRGLAADSHGLCIVTTRQRLPELNNWRTTTAPEWALAKLSRKAGAELLTKLGVEGTLTELEQLAADVKGHALTLTLLGKYLAEAHAGDIRKRDLVSLAEADYEETSGHAFHVMEAYERWLERDGRQVELAILRLLGLFDRPAAPDCLFALRQPPTITGLTDALTSLTDAQWSLALKRLVHLGLIEEQPWEPRRILGYSEELARKAMQAGRQNYDTRLGAPQPYPLDELPLNFNAIEAHPIIREYFGRCLRDMDAWRVAHSRIFEHLRSSVPYWPEGLSGLQPLYQAITHGCHAKRYQEACREVYLDRILRGTVGPHSFYSIKKLGAAGADLAAVGCFFVEPWIHPAPELVGVFRSWLLNEAATRLRALGRLAEAREPMRVGMEVDASAKAWSNAAIAAQNLSELDMTLGDVMSALREAAQSVKYANTSADRFQRLTSTATYAYASHQAGQLSDARERFEEAESMQREDQPHYPLLYSLRGFQFCDLLLSAAESEAWRSLLKHTIESSLPPPLPLPAQTVDSSAPIFQRLHVIEQRSTQTLEWAQISKVSLLDEALDHLTIARVRLYRSILSGANMGWEWTSYIDTAVSRLLQSGHLDYVPCALLTRAWLRAIRSLKHEARSDLDEAQQIAERGPMPLHLADVHLHRARLFFCDDLAGAREDLKQARTLIENCGYLRRIQELEDAERVIFAAK